MDWETWGAPLAVLGVAMLLGAVLGLRSRADSATDDRRTILRARKDQLMEQLRALESEQSKLDPEAYAAQRQALVDEAAETLRAIESDDPDLDQAGAERATHGLWVGAGVFALLLVGAVVLSQTATPRGDEMGGATSAAASAAAAGLPAEMVAALEKLESSPEDMEALNFIGHFALANNQLSAAMQYIDAARKVDPQDPEVRVHIAALQVLVNMHDRAAPILKEIADAQPDWAEPRIWLGLSLARQGEVDAARATLNEVLAVSQDAAERSAAQALLDNLEAAQPRITGRIFLAEGASPPVGSTLFVYARASEAAAGPPRAALKVAGPTLPRDFVFTDGDMMMGGDWPEEAWISARLDADGDPMTRGEDDLLSATVGPLREGDALELILGGDEASQASVDLAPPTPADDDAGDAPAPSEAADGGVVASIRLGDGAAAPEGATLFVYARTDGSGRGMPLAAKKLQSWELPAEIRLGAGDLIRGGAWPAQVWLSAKLDTDGDAMTKADGDLSSAPVGPLGPGESAALTLE